MIYSFFTALRFRKLPKALKKLLENIPSIISLKQVLHLPGISLNHTDQQIAMVLLFALMTHLHL